MQIFKTFLKIIPSYISSLIIYSVIYAVLLMIVIGANDGSSGVNDYSVDIAVTDMDNTEESGLLLSYLECASDINIIQVEQENIQDSLYYRRIKCALTVEEGYAEKLSQGETDGLVSVFTVPSSGSAAYLENKLESYISCVMLYINGGFDAAEASEYALRHISEGVEASIYQQEYGWSDENASGYYFFNFIPYISVMMVLSMLIPLFTAFMQRDIRRRVICSPLRPAFYTLQMFAGAALVCLVISAALAAMGVIVSDGAALSGAGSGYAFLQLFVFVLFSLALAGLVSVICSGEKKTAGYITSMVSQVVGLGMAFLCGVFVSQSLLGDGILTAAKFLPAYWYIRGNNMIWGADGMVFDEGEVWVCIGMQALFALAVFAAALLVSSLKKRESGR